MNKKKIVVLIGILLVLIQAVNYFGVSRMYVQLLPTDRDLLYPSFATRSELNTEKALFAIQAGADRFASGFVDLTFPEDEYRIMTATQITSAMIRESLGCSSGGSTDLQIYDSILVISYGFVGLLGATLIAVSFFIKSK